MNLNRLNSHQRKYLLITAIATIIVVLTLIILSTMFGGSSDEMINEEQDNSSQQDRQPDNAISITINNFDQFVRNLSSQRRADIEEMLFSTVQKNLSDNNTASIITDAQIRENSYSQTYNDQTQIYTTTFIIDIPSIKQSYRVQDMFSNLPPELTGLFDYATQILCPNDDDQLIYGDFSCTDRLIMEGENSEICSPTSLHFIKSDLLRFSIIFSY